MRIFGSLELESSITWNISSILPKCKKLFQSGFFYYFLGFASSLLKYKKFFRLGATKFNFPKYKKNLFLKNKGNKEFF